MSINVEKEIAKTRKALKRAQRQLNKWTFRYLDATAKIYVEDLYITEPYYDFATHFVPLIEQVNLTLAGWFATALYPDGCYWRKVDEYGCYRTDKGAFKRLFALENKILNAREACTDAEWLLNHYEEIQPALFVDEADGYFDDFDDDYVA